MHTFHIPVLGIGFSVDAPLKVARYGISSVVSLVDDTLLERLRMHYDTKHGREHIPISDREDDARARRITAYLDMLHDDVQRQFESLRSQEFGPGTDLDTYFSMLPDSAELKSRYRDMFTIGDEKRRQLEQQRLRAQMVPGSIDVNVMTKIDKRNYGRDGAALPTEFNDAHTAVRGFARSTLNSAIVFSAGMNPRLFGYLTAFEDFFPANGQLPKKRVIIKVSDYRSADIQGRFLAKKGIWVSEYRIESGLNCGGHAFATDGLLLGPILNEFRTRKQELLAEQKTLYLQALNNRDLTVDDTALEFTVTVQGGVGTAAEQQFLLRHYGVSSVGWGSLFLLVPEVINIDDATLAKLQAATTEDLYLSDVSPLGVPFNNLRGNEKDEEKARLTQQGKPGSPCIKKFLSFDTTFSDKPLCTASIAFLKHKLSDLRSRYDGEEFDERYGEAVEKSCLCEGLTISALSVNDINPAKLSKAVAVCPGPNIAYFSRIATLREMVDHIYGRLDLLTDPARPSMFIKELQLYVDYFQRLLQSGKEAVHDAVTPQVQSFRDNLFAGIAYYRSLVPAMIEETDAMRKRIAQELALLEERLEQIVGEVCEPAVALA